MKLARILDRFRRNLAPLLLLLLGTLCLTWFRGHLIDQGDFGLPLNRFDYFYATLSQWDPRWSFGEYLPTQAAALPFASIGAITQLLGMPLLAFEKLMFYVWFTAAGLSMYYLCRTFRIGNWVAALAGAVFMMNPFTLVIVWQVGQGQLQIAYASAPLALASYKGLVETGNLRRLLALTLGWLAIGGSSSFVNPAYLVVFTIPCVVLFIFEVGAKVVARKLSEVRTLMVRSLTAMIVFLMANFFWLLPVLSSSNAQLTSLERGQAAFGSLLSNYNLASANLVDSLRLLGYWALNGGAAYGPYYQWGFEYFQMPLLALTFVAPILAGLALLLPRYRIGVFFAVLLGVGLFLIGGSDPPFGPVNLYMFTNIAFFRAFQEAFERFGFLTALSMAPLTAIGVGLIFKALRGNSSLRPSRIRLFAARLVTVILLFVLLGANVFPFWSGDVIQSPRVSALSPRITIPSDFYALRQFTETVNPSARILSLPLTNSYNTIYNWPGGGYTGSDPTVWFSAVPTVMVNDNNLTRLIEEGQTGTFGPSAFGKLLAITGVDYMVYHADTNFALLDSSQQGLKASSELLTGLLGNFEKVQTYGNISIYQNNYAPYPEVYAPSQIFLLNSTTSSMINLLDSISIEPVIGTVSCRLTPAICTSLQSLSSGTVQATSGQMPYSTFDVPVTNNYTVVVPESSSLVNLRNATLWTQSSMARDSLQLGPSTGFPPTMTLNWTIDRSVGGMRGIVFHNSLRNLTKWTQFSLWVNGDDSGNELILQLYDSAGRYIAFTQTNDWTGWRLISFILSQPSYASGQSSFDYGNIASATLYYVNSVEARANSSIEIGPLQVQTGLKSSMSELSEGLHTTNSSGDSVILLNRNSGSASIPTVSFTRLGSNRFSINITNSTGPFPLVFGNSFDSNWKLCTSSSATSFGLSGRCIPNSNHFVANGYANGWLVNRTGSFSLVLYFAPDVAENYSLAVSALALLAMILFVARPSNVRGTFVRVRSFVLRNAR